MSQDYLNENYRLYRHFWFEIGVKTDTMIARQVIGNRDEFYDNNRSTWLMFGKCYTPNGFDEFIMTDSVHKLDLRKADEQEVVKQFLLSLEIYNLWFALKKRRGSVADVNIDLFFKGDFKKIYKSVWFEDGRDFGQVQLRRLSSITRYNFGHLIDAECVEGICTISFPPYKTELICSKDFYDDLLFPKYLNFISKDHRLTWYQITIGKTDFEREYPSDH